MKYNSITKIMEARAGIEPACMDLQSTASPLRHRASLSWCEAANSESLRALQCTIAIIAN